MTFLDDLAHAGQQAVTSAEGAVGGLVSSAQNATASLLHTAQHDAAQLGTFVNGRIQGPIAEVFGSDPHQFINNAVRAGFSHWVRIVNDCARRGGRTTYTVTDPKTRKPTQIPANLSSSSPFNVVVLTTALAAANNPGLFIDAAGREGAGLGGSGRGIDDVYYWPHAMPHGARGFVEGIPVPTPTDLAAIAAIATIITTIAALVIPALAAAVGFVKNIIAPPPPPPPKSDGTIFGIPPLAILLVAAVGLALVFLWKPKVAAGGAAGG